MGSGGTNGASGGGTSTGGSLAYDCERKIDRDTYAFDQNVPASAEPPGGLEVKDTPLFVALGFDDNPESAGMAWATQMLEDHGVGATFFHTSAYAPDALVQWRAAFDAGFEVALHTVTHDTNYQSSQATWLSEVTGCRDVLTAPWGGGGLGVPLGAIKGFRAPYLEFNDALLSVLRAQGVWYDSTIQEGYDPAQDGTNFVFPYTLDSGSPGHAYNRSAGFARSQFEVTAHPGLFVLPVYALVVPPDSEANKYGFSAGLRSSIDLENYVETGYKITGFDYNLWEQASLDGAEFLAILKYNFDLRRQGNRAPFLFGVHTNLYTDQPERQQALSDFIAYVKTFPEVRVVSYEDVLDFMREPKALTCQ